MSLIEKDGRALLCCDQCPIQMDIGRWAAVKAAPPRSPTGWVDFGNGKHQCPRHGLARDIIKRA